MHIAFIALSGIRACDEELLRLGLTLPGFVERSKAIASLPSLGLLTLAGMTPPRHTTSYHEIDDLRQVETLPSADLVAISSFSAQILEAYELADRYRTAGTTVVLGGLHVTSCPDEAGQYADAIVIGEAEPVWPQLLRDAEEGRLQAVYDARPTPFDMRQAPMPAYHLLDMSRYNRITVQTSRGCPRRCAFCASSILLTPAYKQKPIEKVLAEIDAVTERWPGAFIEFADDNGIIDRKYWRALLPQLARRHIRWFVETDISVGRDPALLDLMRDAGCVEILVGLESPTQAPLKGIELNGDFKHRQFHRAPELIRTIQSHGIRVNGCFVVGLDGHTPAVFDAICRYVEQTQLFDVQVTLPTPFPGTPFYHQLKEQGRLTHDGEWNRCTLFDLNFVPNPMTASELTEGFRKLVTQLYADDFTTWRKQTFRANLRRHLRAQRHTPMAS